MPTHWKKMTNPNYLGVYSLENGQDIILTIKKIREEKVTGTDGKSDNCVVCYFDENVKPMILNATNMKTIQKLYKTPYIEEWVGKKIQIGSEKVKAFGDIVDALRVRKFIPKEQTTNKIIKCSDCGNNIKPDYGKTVEQLANHTITNYGRALCVDCATKAAHEKDSELNAGE